MDTINKTREYLQEIKGINREFYLLKGVLLAMFQLERNERVYDVSLIAQRMDEIDKRHKKQLLESLNK